MSNVVTSPVVETPLSTRELGTLERLWWLIEQRQSFHFSVAAEISGSVRAEDWREALNLLQARHSLLRVHIREDQQGVPRFEPADGLIPLRMVEAIDLEVWRDEMARELGTKFDPATAPLIRATVVSRPDEAVIVLTAHHSIADGISATYLINDLLRLLSGEHLPSLPMPSAQDEWVEKASCRFAVHEPNNEASPEVIVPTPYRASDALLPTVTSLQLSLEVTERLRVRARLEGTTIHGALNAAVLLAGRTISDDWSSRAVRIVSPINARPYLDVDAKCCLHVIAGGVTFPADGSRNFWELARLASTSLAPLLSCENVVTTVSGLREIVPTFSGGQAAEFAATVFARDSAISNLGEVIPPEGHERVTLRAIWGPGVLQNLEGDQQIGAATVRGAGLCLVHASFSPFDQLLERMEEVLTSSCLD